MSAQHLLGFFGGFFNRLGQADTALFASVGFLEFAFAATTCVDLRLDDPERSVEFACCGFRIFCAEDDLAVGDRRAIAAKKGLGLVFVDVHGLYPVCCDSTRAIRPDLIWS